MKLVDMVHIVADCIRKLDTTPYVLAHSLTKVEEAYKVFDENPQITKEEYLEIMGIEEE